MPHLFSLIADTEFFKRVGNAVDGAAAGSFTPPLGADEGGTGVDMTTAFPYNNVGLVFYDPVTDLMNVTSSISTLNVVDGIEIKSDLEFNGKAGEVVAANARLRVALWREDQVNSGIAITWQDLNQVGSRLITAVDEFAAERFYLAPMGTNAPAYTMYLTGQFEIHAKYAIADAETNILLLDDNTANPTGATIFRVTNKGKIYTASGGGFVTSFTAGSVAFSGSDGTLSEDNAGFFYDDTNNNLGLNVNTFGTNAAGVLAIGNGATEVSAAVANTVQLYSVDLSAGNTTLGIFTEGSGALLTGQGDSASATRVKIKVNGTVVELLGV